MRERFDFDGENFGFEGSDLEACPWYMRRLMDQDMIHMHVSDLADPYQCEDVEEYDSDFNSVSTDFVCVMMTPSVLRQMGFNPEGLMSLQDFKLKAMDLIKSVAPLEIKGSTGLFRSRIQRYLNDVLNSMYHSNSFDESKGLVRDVLTFLGADYSLERLEVDDVVLYNTTYLPYVKVLHAIGRFDVNDFRYENRNAHYVKKVPKLTLWDVRDFLEAKASFISSAFYRSFLLSKKDPSDKEWVRLYDEAEKSLSLVNRVLIKIPETSTVNKKKEVWVLNTHDFFYSILKKKLITLAEEIQPGFREDFLTFHLPEEIQNKILNRVVYRPWIKK